MRRLPLRAPSRGSLAPRAAWVAVAAAATRGAHHQGATGVRWERPIRSSHRRLARPPLTPRLFRATFWTMGRACHQRYGWARFVGVRLGSSQHVVRIPSHLPPDLCPVRPPRGGVCSAPSKCDMLSSGCRDCAYLLPLPPVRSPPSLPPHHQSQQLQQQRCCTGVRLTMKATMLSPRFPPGAPPNGSETLTPLLQLPPPLRPGLLRVASQCGAAALRLHEEARTPSLASKARCCRYPCA